MSTTIFIARQPILDRDGRTFGYELLHRDGPESMSRFDDPVDATKQVMERALLQWGMERIIEDRCGLINAHPSLVVSGLHRSMPPDGIVFEVAETDPLDGHALDALRWARREGYHFALDNVRSLASLGASMLLPEASVVKIELTRSVPDELARMIEMVRSHSPDTLVVAEKVETREQYATCVDLGFDLFQGFYFAEPELLERDARPASSTAAMALLAEMQRNDIDITRTEELVASDPALAYRILAVVNSSAFGLRRRVDSLRHAIVLLGITQVRSLAALIALSSTERSEELLTTGAVRARLASSLTPDAGRRTGAFTVGLLSITDAIFGTPMEELVRDLSVSDEIESALIDRAGPLGRTLDIVLACERADTDRLAELVPDDVDVQAAYDEAINWADSLGSTLPRRRAELPLRADRPYVVPA